MKWDSRMEVDWGGDGAGDGVGPEGSPRRRHLCGVVGDDGRECSQK